MLTNEIENITNASVIGLSVVPAVPPAPPTPPSLPPLYENTTLEDQGITVVETVEIVPPPPLPVEPSSGDGEVSIDFVIPTEMRVTMEPHPLVSIIPTPLRNSDLVGLNCHI